MSDTNSTGTNDTGDQTEWVCGVSVNKIHQGYVLAGFMVLTGLSLMFVFDSASEDAALIGMINIGFAVVIFVLTRRSLENSSRLLVLNREGVWYRDWKGPVIPWDQITNIQVSGTRIKASVRIILKDPEAIITMLDAAERTAFEKNPLFNKPVLKIPNGALAIPLEQVHEKMTDLAQQWHAAS